MYLHSLTLINALFSLHQFKQNYFLNLFYDGEIGNRQQQPSITCNSHNHWNCPHNISNKTADFSISILFVSLFLSLPNSPMLSLINILYPSLSPCPSNNDKYFWSKIGYAWPTCYQIFLRITHARPSSKNIWNLKFWTIKLITRASV